MSTVRDRATRSTGREEILSAAVELFAAKGYSRVSIRELAARAGCSTANLYHHFPSKYAICVSLIEGAMDQHFAGLQEALERSDDPVEQLRYVLRNHLIVHMTRPEVRLLDADLHPVTVDTGAMRVRDPALAVRAAMGACTSVDRWFNPRGPLTAPEVADRTADYLVAGFGTAAT